MNPNEQSWPSRQRQHREPSRPPQSGYRVFEETLVGGQIQIENKFFDAKLKQNTHGRFVRIIENVAGRHNTIIIPIEGLREFHGLLTEMIEASASLPPKEKQEPKGP